MLFFISALLFVPGIGNALEITFKQRCSVDGEIVKLQDVALLDEQGGLAQALGSQPVAKAPAPGEKVYLRSITMKQYLVRSQTLPSDITWSGSPTVEVTRNGIYIGPGKIEELISEYLDEHKNSLPEAEIRFVPGSLPIPFILPKGDLTYEVIPSKPSIMGSSRFSLIFRIDNRVVKNMSVRGRLEAIGNVVVTTKPVKKGRVLSRDHLKVARMDINNLSETSSEVEDFLGMKLKRSLRAGSPVTASMVETLPVVHRGERVKIVIHSGSMLLTATGLAHSDGRMNQIIKVQNINSSKVVFCRVTAPGLVEVVL